MASEKRKEIVRWIRGAFYQDRKAGRCLRLAVKHITASKQKGDEVWTCEVPESPPETLIDEIISEIEASTGNDADAIGGTQTYALIAYFGTSQEDEKPIGRFNFRVYGSDDDGDGSADVETEPASIKGVLAQHMRHTEGAIRLALGSSGKIIESQNTMMEKLIKQNEALHDKLISQRELVEDLKDKKLERDLLVREHEASEHSKDAILGKLMALFPIVVAKLAPKAAGFVAKEANHGSATEALLSSFLESITQDQFSKLQASLTPDQQMLVLSMMQEHQKNEEAAKAAKEKERQERKKIPAKGGATT